MKSNLTNNKKGFTLIELLVVLLIIGLLATISVVALGTARAKGRDTRRLTDIKGIQNALELYFIDKNGYPDDKVAGLGSSPTIGTVGGAYARLDDSGWSALADTDTPVYIVKAPLNPTPNGANYVYTSTDSAGLTCDASPCATYTLTFNLESGAGGYAAGARTATPPDVVQ
ncbi:MAG TPA: prepilin-type N-terminal cleavage/methylation domain-containing protein [Patescibacteria group bacterium]|nr:prepilin-type N-terminal cleavage/methylation domain-containing protein [Patescibacteria group bacterium]